MALGHTFQRFTWGASDTTSVAGGGTATSDILNPSDTEFQGQIGVKADHGGTPAAGDTVEFWLLQSIGDIDGDGTDDYETDEQGTFLATLDLNADDPAISIVEKPIPQSGAKVLAKNNDADTAVTVSAAILEQTG